MDNKLLESILEQYLRADLEELDIALAELLEGGRLKVMEMDGRVFYLRQPTSAERDDADLYKQIVQIRLRQREDIQALNDAPLTDAQQEKIQQEVEVIARRLDVEKERHQLRWHRTRLAALYDLLKRTQMDLLIERRSEMAWHRWLARRLLVDEAGRPVVESEEAWEDLPPALQDAATVTAAKMMRLIYRIPFGLEARSAPESD